MDHNHPADKGDDNQPRYFCKHRPQHTAHPVLVAFDGGFRVAPPAWQQATQAAPDLPERQASWAAQDADCLEEPGFNLDWSELFNPLVFDGAVKQRGRNMLRKTILTLIAVAGVALGSATGALAFGGGGHGGGGGGGGHGGGFGGGGGHGGGFGGGGGHGGGFGGGGFHGGGFGGGGFRGGGYGRGYGRGWGGGYGGYGYGYGLGYPYYGYGGGYYGGYGYPYGYSGYYNDSDVGGCYLVRQRVMTPYGWRIRRAQVCD